MLFIYVFHGFNKKNPQKHSLPCFLLLQSLKHLNIWHPTAKFVFCIRYMVSVDNYTNQRPNKEWGWLTVTPVIQSCNPRLDQLIWKQIMINKMNEMDNWKENSKKGTNVYKNGISIEVNNEWTYKAQPRKVRRPTVPISRKTEKKNVSETLRTRPILHFDRYIIYDIFDIWVHLIRSTPYD